MSKKTHIRILNLELKTYDTFLKRLKGLMFQLKPIKNEAIILEPCNSIHMFFMFFPIDVVFLDKENRVVKTKEDVKPWTVIFPVKHAYKTIEMPVGSIRKFGIRDGCVIEV
ncbi:DUF192 domain-containing protein [Bacillus sp. JJ1533]|uniref:DUF192 domain-containing protein n=1 Tax=Bacillus sp. JJ1533 TaxID=3122959 RepID=UPI003000A857